MTPLAHSMTNGKMLSGAWGQPDLNQCVGEYLGTSLGLTVNRITHL